MEGTSPDQLPDAPVTSSRAGEGTAARRLALSIILESDGGRKAFIDDALDAGILKEELSERDRHLLQEIAYGAVRHRNTLDHLLDEYVRFAMKRQEPPVRWTLRLGAYQVVYLGRIPPHAAVDRTLEVLKEFPRVGRREVGFANAVLRRLAGSIYKKTAEPPLDPHDPTAIPIRSGWCHFDHPVLPLHTLEPVRHLALKHSHPQWMVERFCERLGEEEAVRLCEANNRIPRVVARITARSPGREAVYHSLAEAGTVAEPLGDSVLLKRPGNLHKLEALSRGWIQIQDPTSTTIGEALAPPPGARVLDLCAAPGGKAVQILERIGQGGSLLSCDVDEERLGRLQENLERAGGNFTLRLVSPDPEDLELGESFSHILLDAPCSSTGVLARRPEARWRIRREDLPRLAEKQKRLLAAAVRRLAPGGRLVYATCSIEPEENQEVVEWGLETLAGLEKTAERLFLPHRDPGDGGYYAVLEAKGAAEG